MKTNKNEKQPTENETKTEKRKGSKVTAVQDMK
jgi:hypothetical protein